MIKCQKLCHLIEAGREVVYVVGYCISFVYFLLSLILLCIYRGVDLCYFYGEFKEDVSFSCQGNV